MAGRSWTNSEEILLEELYPEQTMDVIREEINRSEEAISSKASKLGLRKHPSFRHYREASEISPPQWDDDFAHFVCGFVTGEGSFSRVERDNRPRSKYEFQIQVSDVDTSLMETIDDFFGEAGAIYHYESREDEWRGFSVYKVEKIAEHIKIIIPFFDRYGLRTTHKEKQYIKWRDKMISEYRLQRLYNPISDEGD